MSHFVIDPPLAKAPVDRSEDLREPARLQAMWPTARVLPVTADGAFPTWPAAGGVRLAFAAARSFGEAPPAEAVLLGYAGGIDYWALPVAEPGAAVSDPTVSAAAVPAATVRAATGSAAAAPAAAGGSAGVWPADAVTGTVRGIAALLPDDEAELATTAAALVGWHGIARFCTRCGRAMAPELGGHSRRCSSGHQEFPRLDPAVIVLVHDGDDHIVLARQPSWQPGRFSVLAGFAEAGESLEATVAREIGEEVGLDVADIDYLGSQPWPFPRSLMIAFSARAQPGAPLTPRAGEIDAAHWFSRAQLRAALAEQPAPAGGVTLPGAVSIARRMVEAFVDAV